MLNIGKGPPVGLLNLIKSVNTKSGLPFPSQSPIAIFLNCVPISVVIFVSGEKDMFPTVLVFFIMPTLVEELINTFRVIMISGLPSPFTSLAKIPDGALMETKSTRGTKFTDVPIPVFQKTDIALLPLEDTAISALPSPSKSAIAEPKGLLPVFRFASCLKPKGANVSLLEKNRTEYFV